VIDRIILSSAKSGGTLLQVLFAIYLWRLDLQGVPLDFGPSKVCALHLGFAGRKKLTLLMAFYLSYFLLLSSLSSGYFSPRRGCPRVMKLDMGS
jgi:hypothetical protein